MDPTLDPIARIRKEVLARRAQWIKTPHTESITQTLVNLFWSRLEPELNAAPFVALYQSRPGEFPAERLEPKIRALGLEPVYPRVVSDTEIEFAPVSPIASDDSSWNVGAFGIREPALSQPTVDPALLRVVVVPGVAFDRSGGRIGSGKGFYDRFLARCPLALRVAAAYDYQWCESIPTRAWDQPMNWVQGSSP